MARGAASAAMPGVHAISARANPRNLDTSRPSCAHDGNAQQSEDRAASREERRHDRRHRSQDNQQQDRDERQPPAEEPSGGERTVPLRSAYEPGELLRCALNLDVRRVRLTREGALNSRLPGLDHRPEPGLS